MIPKTWHGCIFFKGSRLTLNLRRFVLVNWELVEFFFKIVKAIEQIILLFALMLLAKNPGWIPLVVSLYVIINYLTYDFEAVCTQLRMKAFEGFANSLGKEVSEYAILSKNQQSELVSSAVEGIQENYPATGTEPLNKDKPIKKLSKEVVQ